MDFGRPENPLEKKREINNEARISKKAEMKKKFNRNQKRITLWDIQLSSITSLSELIYNESKHQYEDILNKSGLKTELTYKDLVALTNKK